MTIAQDLRVETNGPLGWVRLSRPQALNSLTPEMVLVLDTALERFEADPAISAVLVTGEGERAFCAGGDIRALYDRGRGDLAFGLAFFRSEYRMNAHIAAYPKPYVAVMDGITMGGGVGISAHGSLRIVTERTRLAMPETGIGFFPDIGATWLLSHAPGEIGTYMALTGEIFSGADAIYAGLADLLIDSAEIPRVIATLAALPAGTDAAAMRAALAAFARPVAPPLARQRAEIDRAFAHDDIEQIIAALRALGSEFAAQTLTVLAKKSPTSLKVTLRLLRSAARDLRLEESLAREFAAVHQVLVSEDFYEGVRAAVVDKDRNPKWRPADLADVSEAMVEAYFKPAPQPLFGM